MKKSKIKKILIFIIVVNIVLMIIFLIWNHSKQDDVSSKNTNEIDQERNTTEYTRLDTIYPMMISKFSEQYKGNIADEYILKKITNFIYYIEDHKADLDKLSDEEIIEEYNNNIEEINELGIESQEVFKEFVQKIKELPQQNLEYSYSELVISSLIVTEDSTSIDLAVKFVNCDEIKFNIKINNQYQKNAILVKFSPSL